jgi:hypothetical protein
MTRARSLSQLANSNVFSVDANNSRVGIGSTIPDVKLDVGGDLYADDLTVRNITGVAATFSGVVSYEDVTNVDSVGIITARDNIELSGENANIRFTDASGSESVIRSRYNLTLSADHLAEQGSLYSNLIFKTDGSEKLRITSGGLIGIGTDSPKHKLNVYNETAGSAGGILVQNVTYTTNEDRPYLIVGTKDWTGATTNWNTYGFQHRIKSNSGGSPRITIDTFNGEAFCVDNSGLVGIGTDNPGTQSSSANNLVIAEFGGEGGITIKNDNNSTGHIFFADTDATAQGRIDYGHSGDYMRFYTANTEKLRITSGGLIGIGTDNPGVAGIDILANSAAIRCRESGGADARLVSGGSVSYFGTYSNHDLQIVTNGSNALRIGTLGQVGFNTTLLGSSKTLHIAGDYLAAGTDLTDEGLMFQSFTTPTTGQVYPGITWSGNPVALGRARAGITAVSTNNASASALVFMTRSAPDATSLDVTDDERMRITENGEITNKSGYIDDLPGGGFTLARNRATFTSSNSLPMRINRDTSDGNLITFHKDSAEQGSISVSGSTVSYNGAHLSRWSQILGIDPYDKAVRPEILRGTLMSNLDEMCDWTCPESGDCQDNEQLNKTKISDVEGDKNVAGIFQSWDDDDDTWVNDYYLAMERGDLLMSAGDGTAKPQDDDIIRSKTIAKVTSTNVSCTYDDGSYCVPCVLMGT